MGVLYGFILIVILVLGLCALDLDEFGVIISIILCIVLGIVCVIPHPSWGTEIIESTSYELISLNEIDDDYKETDYILYEPVSDKFIFYYKDSNGIIRRQSLSTDSSYTQIAYGKDIKYTINTLDYNTKTKRHLLFNSFSNEYILFVPEGSVIQSLLPEYIGG